MLLIDAYEAWRKAQKDDESDKLENE